MGENLADVALFDELRLGPEYDLPVFRAEKTEIDLFREARVPGEELRDEFRAGRTRRRIEAGVLALFALILLGEAIWNIFS